MDEDEVVVYHETLLNANDLTIVEHPNDNYNPNSMYLHLLFDKEEGETGWQIRTFVPYNRDSYDEFPKGSKPCHRGTP